MNLLNESMESIQMAAMRLERHCKSFWAVDKRRQVNEVDLHGTSLGDYRKRDYAFAFVARMFARVAKEKGALKVHYSEGN
jgi:hypothetical protein